MGQLVTTGTDANTAGTLQAACGAPAHQNTLTGTTKASAALLPASFIASVLDFGTASAVMMQLAEQSPFGGVAAVDGWQEGIRGIERMKISR